MPGGDVKPAPVVAAVGEAVWDVYPDAEYPGGSPANVAFHAARLGNTAALVTRVGADDRGNRLVTVLAESGVETTYVQRDNERPTGTVRIASVGDEPHFDITPDAAWDQLSATAEALRIMQQAAGVVVGTLAQRTGAAAGAVTTLLRNTSRGCTVLYDVNLRPPFVDADVIRSTAEHASVVKMNSGEVESLRSVLRESDPVQCFLRDYGVEAVCVTLGAQGAEVHTSAGSFTCPGVSVDTTTGDPVGAGDAFVAALMHGLVRSGMNQAALMRANRYGALVATRRGAMPLVSDEELGACGF